VLTLNSCAKINWTLEVLGRRPDGYHELRTVFQTVDLADTLTFEPLQDGIVIECDHPEVPTDERNLVWKAANLVQERAGIKSGVRIRIIKRIPTAAGLGGGSSNAAVTLLALLELWRLEIPWTELLVIGARIGADVPFFLLGGTGLGVGRGDEVYPLAGIDAPFMLLVNPGILIPTREVYANLPAELTNPETVVKMPLSLGMAYQTVRHLDSSAPMGSNRVIADPSSTGATGADQDPAERRVDGLTVADSTGRPKNSLYPWLAGLLRNDLELSVLPRYPVLADIRRRLPELGARAALMSGSGSTLFAVFDNGWTRQEAANTLQEEGWWVAPVKTVDRAEYRRLVLPSRIEL